MIVIFGASGLIGQYLVEDLVQHQHEVFAVVHRNRQNALYNKYKIPHESVDISHAAAFSKLPQQGVDTVIFLAGVLPAGMPGYEPQKYFEVNTIGALNAFEYARNVGAKQILYTQSHSDVGALWGKKTIGAYETPAINYTNDHTVYIISKLAAASLLEHYYQMYGISYGIFRCPNIYAYHPDMYYYQNGKKTLIAYRYFIQKALKGEPIELWGKYESQRDVVYVKDLTQMIRKAVEKNIDKGVYNVSNGQAVSLHQQITDIIEVFSPKDNPSQIIPRPDIDIPEIAYHYDISNAVEDLGYEPKFFHKEMLLDMKKIMQEKY